MTHTDAADAAEKEFDAWWTHTGERITADIVTSAMDKQEAIRLFSRIAYFQGRIDEDDKLEAQINWIKHLPWRKP